MKHGWRPWAAWALTAAVLAAVTSAWAFPETFSRLAFYDDTGYMLAIIRSFNAQGGLYTRVFSQYGPWYSEFYALVCRGLGVPATQDGIRWISVAAWLVGSAAAGAFTLRLTGRLALAALAQLFGFLALRALSIDAGHPVGLCVLCVAAAVCGLLPGTQGGPWRTVGFGAALGALGLVKINLGVYALAAVGTAWAFGTPRDFLGRLLRVGAGALLCLLPLLLVRGGWSGSVRAFYLAVILASLLGIVTVLGRTEPDAAATWREAARTGLGMSAGWVLTWIAGIAGIVATGTRPADVLGGMLLRPLALSTVFSVEPHTAAASLLAALAGLGGALGWRFLLPALAARFGASWIEKAESALRWFFLALLLGGTMLGRATTPLLPFLWIGLLPPPVPTRASTGPFARRVLPLLAAAEFLSLYPVAGIQSVVISYLEVLVAVLVVAALCPRPLAAAAAGAPVDGAPVRGRLAFGVAALAVAGLFVWQTASLWRMRARLVPLALPDSTLVRDEESTVASYESLAANLAGQRSFLTLPGINSLYPWAQVDYPAGPNCTENFALLTPDEQRVLVETARRSEPVAMVYRSDLYDWWVQQHAPTQSVLAEFLHQGCRPIGQVGPFTLLRNAAQSPLASGWTRCALVERSGPKNSEQPTGRILIKGASSFQPASAILVAIDGSALTPAMAVAPDGLAGDLVLTVPDPAALRARLPGTLGLRLCDAAGRRLTTVPFFVPAE